MEQVTEKVTETLKKVAIGGDKPQKEKKQKKEKGAPAAGGDAGPLEMNPPPAFIQERLDLFDKLYKEQQEELAKRPRDDILITMPDGTTKTGKAYETTPAEIAKGISNSLFKRTVVARIDGETLWDLERPLEKSCKLELLDFNDDQGKFVFWHSSAHILGEACERRFGCSLCIGPPVDNGFYYEMALPGGAAVQSSDWAPLENIVTKIVKEKQPFQRLEMSKEDLLKMFAYNPYKQHIIKDKIPDGTRTTVYRNGPLIDLCRGPHVPDTSRIEAFAIMKNSSSYFLGDANNDSLQRIYGVSFPDKKQMAAHKKFLEEAAKRDHRLIGKQQELFYFEECSPGSAMWLPHGMRINNAIMEYIKEEYWKRGYDEVMTPNMFNVALWEQSGHLAHYKDDMFILDVDKEQFGLKPMNCPAHAMMFRHRDRSHKELPLRLADFGVLHRNEASGALSGLTRVRRFQQDDAHIFCREDQIKAEVADLFDFMKSFYGMLGLTFKLKLSTRPEKYMGEIETWDRAEARLKEALNEFVAATGGTWELNEGDGAFYGPKIDIAVLDCLNRPWQCATIQLDFQQPINFSLEYMTADAQAKQDEDKAASKAAKPEAPKEEEEAPKEGEEKKKKALLVKKPLTAGCARPVMIHRAMAGSIERFTAILAEHFAGKWPFWMSPRQVMVIPVGMGFLDYAKEVALTLKKEKIHVDVDSSGNTLQKKIRSAQLAQYNFIFVVGDDEKTNRKVNIRYRDDTSTQARDVPYSLEEAVEKLRALKADRGMYNPFPAHNPKKEEATKEEVKA
ncbi:threonyl-tRNA synthetase [Neurospora crassa]|uniref:threonine--tRNA ligase n=1 Tax=Neurospora crassa (strain ATCC 24698 / 74-OR23-1A / CBS 708.71 / DSM 1257 / FGSC 987) TaxID=367110 RepID=V5IKE8_NEUCR|nr:threonyl-tRNA synthetase, variant 2 [Neurospora crassa OR74A]XP_011395157.1 threonyl-tRNA synthetase [Neurospora crassa OR74A]XP_011395158.1 threonyl-tRNA synthetase, variant 1 [Neurospora crassa OR74A]KHE78643.1 threonyl-tRNA synthetase [Neurospora crassa]ESA41972.1 threonyl-tRNA synthetase [Neurospora crassa OR74A]ESA41973.1 threonyl-tRNA synthetase, variant 1 [Neurospora crassa OR74A]ESA41974.1 threonyl-tRNA synthetase, variant 2 [Neurospora crassa OR74A]|eukprot:XP_011395156.1 threonyl-tRNA synthetase, variant 2 [Neurospora crassa OR74A]